MTGLLGYGGCHDAIHHAGVLLMLGTDFPFANFLPDKKVKTIQVDRDPGKIGRRAPLELGVVGDVPATLRALAPLVQDKNHDHFLREHVAQTEHARRRLGHYVTKGPGIKPIRPQYVAAWVADVFTQAAGTQIPVTDLRPLPEGNSAGLLPFCLMLAATVTGFVTMFQLRAHAARLSLRAWLGCVLALAVLVGGTLSVLTGPVIGAQHGPLPELWAAIAGMTVVAALWASTMKVLAGAWSFIPIFGLLMVVGIQSSGGAVAPPLFPPFYRFCAQFLPSGAAVDTIRNALYFTDAQHAVPVIVLAAWIAGLLAALLLATRLRGRTPGGQPYHGRRHHAASAASPSPSPRAAPAGQLTEIAPNVTLTEGPDNDGHPGKP